ncbi:MAG: calcium/sodium antiporter [Rhizobiales bacterium]|nr:calcium/sodium antiporter [Hyphomicrobiales bacterium]
MTYLMLGLGLAGLMLGGELLVRGAVAIAARLGISPLVIGLTLVGFGTSTPELVTSIQAAAAGSPGIAVGNVVGSNIANIFLILGLAALLRPIVTRRRAMLRDGSVLLAVTIACGLTLMAGSMGRAVGLLFVALLATYVVATYFHERGDVEGAGTAEPNEMSGASTTIRPILFALGQAGIGLLVLLVAADVLVRAAIELAASLGVSETLIGLTVVAVGTSLPELATSTMAAVRGQGDVAFGNIVGSNIFNILGILGVTAVVQPLVIPPEIMQVDVWVMLAATAALLVVAVTGWRVTRLEGGALLAAYAGYVVLLSLTSAGAAPA